MKKDVLANDGLPPRREVVVYAGMTTVQRGYYELVSTSTLRDTLVSVELVSSLHQYKVCCCCCCCYLSVSLSVFLSVAPSLPVSLPLCRMYEGTQPASVL